MKVGFVVPRYGTEVVGGAELAVRLLAEHLTAFGPTAEVFTTCAVDSRSWANELPPGDVDVNGVLVHRFLSDAGRDPRFEEASARLLPAPATAAPDDEARWIELQGPVCPKAIAAASASDADVLAFCPYLYYPTVRGIAAARRATILHPAAHDELPLHLPMFSEVFAAASGLAFFTQAERTLVERLFRVAGRPQAVVGLGVDRVAGDAARFRGESGIADRPYVLCLGRVDEGKGTTMLARMFAAYKAVHPGPLALAIVGPVVHPPPGHPDIVVTGAVDESSKWGAIDGAVALVSPSPLESFAIVLIEAWATATPVIVNARCDATREHCTLSNGGLWFESLETFVGALDAVTQSPALAGRLGAAGKHYVEAHFGWPSVVARYERLLQAVLRSRGQ